MFDLNTIQPSNPDLNGRAVKNFRYFLFSVKTIAEKEEPLDTIESKTFSKEECLSIIEQVEEMSQFDEWVNFGDTWDVVWAGLYVETDKSGKPIDVFWKPKFHSVERQLLFPIRLAHINSTKRMETSYIDTRDIMNLKVPSQFQSILKEKAKAKEVLERQMVAEALPGGDAFAKEMVKTKKMEEMKRKQDELNEQLKALAKIENDDQEDL